MDSVRILDCPHAFGPHTYVWIPDKGWYMITIMDLPHPVEVRVRGDKREIGSLTNRAKVVSCHGCGLNLTGDGATQNFDASLAVDTRNYVPGNNTPLDEVIKQIQAAE